MLLILLTLLLITFAGWPGQPNQGAWLARLLLGLTLSPVLRYVDVVFGFAVRLRLSQWAGFLLRSAGVPVAIDGNILVLYGQEMAVDPACMGLRMTSLTLLLAVFWLLAYERRQVRSLPLGWVLAYGSVAFGLTVLSNLIRIVLLVLFGLGPDHPLHELVGLACMVIYAWLPLWALARWVIGRYGVQWQPTVASGGFHRALLWRSGFVIASLTLFSFAFVRPVRQLYFVGKRAGYERTKTLFGFVQYSRPGELIYVKPLPDWYSAEHSPVFCWKGQGYTLRRIREVVVAGQPMYVGELRKGQQRLQTAWWFSNGLHRSIGQVDIRTRMLCGEPGFALINVTVAEVSALPAAVKAWR
ncbi:exosortase N [uncultured Fibrella sp.]|uniref:exosortase N n=1 Tax=uncultured Fibrella sp. TaxID=1284596 RepID=UPI0035CADCBE